MDKIYPVRYDETQYDALERAAKRFGVTGRQKAQREINRLYMAYFGLINDPIAAAAMILLIEKRRKTLERRGMNQAVAGSEQEETASATVETASVLQQESAAEGVEAVT